jgi:hypothetical protein
MTTPQKRLHNPARRLRLNQAETEPGQRAPADYPLGYIEQLARKFSDGEKTSAGPLPARRPTPSGSGRAAAAGLG